MPVDDATQADPPSGFAVGDPDGSLRAAVAAVGRRWSRSQYRLLHLIVELDNSGAWALDGARTCAHWVAATLDVEISTCREWLRIGRRLGELRRIDASLRAGRLSYSKVRHLTRLATVDNEAELIEIAENTTAGRLGTELAAWAASNEDPDETKRRQWEERSLNWRVEPDGMVFARMRLPPQMAALLMATVDASVLKRRSELGKATDSDNDASADAQGPRRVRAWASIAQQRADALIALLNQGGAAVETEVVLHVRADGCTLDDGTPIAGSEVEKIAPQSFIRALIHDAESHPINASGRHRHPTTRQKRVVHERDKGCVDCGSTSFLEFDHVPDFAMSGRTCVDELQERCWDCHRGRHAQQGAGS